jgi:VWFA-related protein
MNSHHCWSRRLPLRSSFLASGLLVCLVSCARGYAQTPPDQPAPAPSGAPAPPAASTPPATTTQSAPSLADDQSLAGVIRKETRLVLVDTVVTDKKGNYVRDLTQKDFKVFEDNKEQTILSFAPATDVTVQANGQRRYLILFFDNSTMDAPDQIQARGAASKFIDANSGPDHLMAVVDFGGSLRIVQNFTANATILQAAVSGVKNSSVDPNAGQPVTIASTGISSLSTVEADFGARSMLLAVRSLAKNLRAVPGRKMLVLFSGGFPLTPESESELTATIDACNKANVAIYALDARGLVATAPGGKVSERRQDALPLSAAKSSITATNVTPTSNTTDAHPHLVLASYAAEPAADPQRPGGGGGGTGGGGRPGGGGGGTGGGTGGTGGGGTGGRGGTGGTGGTGGGRTGGTGTTGTGGTGVGRGGNFLPGTYNSPFSQPRTIVPPILPSTATNQQILAALAEGTGGFTIFNTNDLLGGLQRIGNEQSEFYVLSYAPPETPEGSCHTLKVKVGRGGTNVRSRSGYCNEKPANPLEGKPVEKQLEARAGGTQEGSIHGALQAPYFYTGPNVARVNLAMEIPSENLQFNKDKGKYHANINVLGIAYKPDGSIGARFSDTVNFDLEKDEVKEFTKIPYHYENQFDAAAGNYKLTIVLTAGGDAFGKFESPLQIDAFDGKKLALSGLVLTNSVQSIGQISTGLDSVLLEDRTPLVVKGMQIIPSGTNRFKKSEHVVLYTEVYEPLLTSEKPPLVGIGYSIVNRITDKEVFKTGAIRADEYIQKGSPIIPVGLIVPLKDVPAGNYRLVMQAIDAAGNRAPNRSIAFDVTD